MFLAYGGYCTKYYKVFSFGNEQRGVFPDQGFQHWRSFCLPGIRISSSWFFFVSDFPLCYSLLKLFPEGGKILAEFSNSIELGKLGQKHMFLQLSQTFSNFLPHLMLPPSLTNMTALTENIFKVYRSTLLSLWNYVYPLGILTIEFIDGKISSSWIARSDMPSGDVDTAHGIFPLGHDFLYRKRYDFLLRHTLGTCSLLPTAKLNCI